MRTFSTLAGRLALTRLTLALVTATPAACSKSPAGDGASRPLVTDVQHSAVKHQSIGNCWLYAAASWAESLHLAATGEEVDLSESYWTWWHFYDQLVSQPTLTEIATGGWWFTSNGLIAEHGFLYEGEFIAEESEAIRSERQKAAVAYVNAQLLPGGTLATPAQRTPEAVRAQLDLAFGVDMQAAETQARDAATFAIGVKPNGATLSLLEATSGDATVYWQYVGYDRVDGQSATPSFVVEQNRKTTLGRVMRALNDKKPVVMTLMIDFNAWNHADGVFDVATLAAAGEPGKQGAHMLVLEDYAVGNVPGVGDIGEGDVSPELKTKALTGDLRYFVTKNSWSPSVAGGYHRFTRAYLDGQLAWKNPSGQLEYYTTLTGFILPPGY